jgi:hypothetical protein
MPPRKSNPATASIDEAETATVPVVEPTETSPPPVKVYKEPKAPKAPREDDTLSVEDLNLPKSIVQRLAKGVLPPNTQIQKDALLAMSKGATVFVNYLTSAYVASHPTTTLYICTSAVLTLCIQRRRRSPPQRA